MNKKHNKELDDAMHKKVHSLMESATQRMFGQEEHEGESLYDVSTHIFLQKETVPLVGKLQREVMLPLPKDDWPDKFIELKKNYDSNMKWPQYAMYNYSNDVLMPPFIPSSLLHFGYAVVNDLLVSCPFFVVFEMVDHDVEGEIIAWPESFVIDPLAEMNDIHPEAYIGIRLEYNFIANWFMNRGKYLNPLDAYISQKSEEENRERLHDAYMEAYTLQMAHEPEWFPKGLIDFANKERLYVPPDQKSSN